MAITLITLLLLTLVPYENFAVPLPPLPGECENTHTDIYPPRIMETWHVIKHTDSLNVRPNPDCLMMVFGRRMSFNSQMRMDIVQSHALDEESSESVGIPPLRGSLTIQAGVPFNITIPESLYFPKNIMVTDFHDNDECMAFWSCTQIGPTMTQKGAWILCKTPEVEEDVVENLVQKVSTASGIDPSFFSSTKYEDCN